MKHGLNVPLTRAQVKLLGRGFTPTSIGITGQELKRSGRNNGYPHTNAPMTRGRNVQYIPIPEKDTDGTVLRIQVEDKKGNMVMMAIPSGRFKQVFHKPIHQ